MPTLLCHTSTHTTPVLSSFGINQAVVEDDWSPVIPFPAGHRFDVPAGATYVTATIGVIQPVGLVSFDHLNFQGGIVDNPPTMLMNTSPLSMTIWFNPGDGGGPPPIYATRSSPLLAGGAAWHYHVDAQPGGGPSDPGLQFYVELLFYCDTPGSEVPIGVRAFESGQIIERARGRSFAQVIG